MKQHSLEDIIDYLSDFILDQKINETMSDADMVKFILKVLKRNGWLKDELHRKTTKNMGYK